MISSGLGGVFPAGYPVGRVLEVQRRPDQAFAEIFAEPVSALDRDREVLLVWNVGRRSAARLGGRRRRERGGRTQ